MRPVLLLALLLASRAVAAPCVDTECVPRCEAGEGRSCYRLAQGQVRDVAKDLLELRACTLGYAPGCELAAVSESRRLELSQVLCDGGDIDACPDATCAQGNLHACRAAKTMPWPTARTVPTVSSPAELVACLEGHPDMCMVHAFKLEYGLGVPADRTQAAEFYAGACMNSVLAGCVQAARFASPAQAVWFLEQACPPSGGPGCAPIAARQARAVPSEALRGTCEDDPFACFALGNLLERAPPDESFPFATVYAKGCTGGCPRSCRRLGELFRDGKSLAPDAARAAAFFSRACSLGDARSCSKSVLMPRP
jgi:uncharacterized protein